MTLWLWLGRRLISMTNGMTGTSGEVRLRFD